jgi:hypothetical protein
VVGIIGKINVGLAMFGALIVVSPAIYLVAVLLRRPTNRWRHVKPKTLRLEYILWRRQPSLHILRQTFVLVRGHPFRQRVFSRLVLFVFIFCFFNL